MTDAQRQHRFSVILAFGLVYFFWGSTYLGISIAVEHDPARRDVRHALPDCRRT